MKSYLFNLLFLITIESLSQQEIKLYPGEIPNSKSSADQEKREQSEGIVRVSQISRPTLTVFLPSKEKANGTAVIICPGGGYWINAISHEGTDVAKKFNEWGVAALVLKYRIPNEATMINKEIGPLQDAQRAIQLVRERSQEWKINPDRIGIMGFSAGGHLASTAGTHFNKAVIENPTGISLRPDFMVLIYPVISFQDAVGHSGSRNQLIGTNPAKEKIEWYSNEMQVSTDTPPAFLVHASDDDAVKSENSIVFYQALRKKNIPVELHIYQKGGHGFGMKNPTTSDSWMDRLQSWMKANAWLN
jgi:acetyl esterase/lipase